MASLHGASPAVAAATVGLALLDRGAGDEPRFRCTRTRRGSPAHVGEAGAYTAPGTARYQLFVEQGSSAPTRARCTRSSLHTAYAAPSSFVGARARPLLARCVSSRPTPRRGACIVRSHAGGLTPPPPPRAGTCSRARSADFGLSIIRRAPASVVRCAPQRL